ncbi:MAG TPA: polysaccharide biosynthesis/export family protein [Gemmatimonadales bacterium]|nr:polysaccharide biosynthesis/export family protein [Gemmatimonadales bacterium]
MTNAQLRPGDVLRITVWRQPELSGEFHVLQSGTIGHPLYQSIMAVGTPLPELTERIRTYLTRLVNDPQVVIEPLVSVAVGGEVRTPGLYTLPLGTTISQAIAQAGGGGDEGSLRNVRLIRNGQREQIDLADLRVNRASEPVQSGDQIFVSRRSNTFRDIIGPLASVLAAAAAIITVSRQ